MPDGAGDFRAADDGADEDAGFETWFHGAIVSWRAVRGYQATRGV